MNLRCPIVAGRGAEKSHVSLVRERVDSRRSTPRCGDILENSGGISPGQRVQFKPNGAPQIRDGWSASFDLVYAYSDHHTAGKRAATPQNRLTKTVHTTEEDEPFIRAAIAALLSTRNMSKTSY